MANNLIQIKRTSVSGRAANSSTLVNPGELALNMVDGIMYSTNGSTIFEIGANTTNSKVTTALMVGANAVHNTSAYYITGNTTTAPTMTLLGTGLTVGNSTITGAPQIVLANTSGTTTINTIYVSTTSISGNLIGNVSATFVNASANVVVGANVVMNTSTFVVSNTTAITTHTILGVNAGNSSVTTAPQILVQNTAGVTTINSNFISTTSISGNLTGNVTATNLSGNLTGNVTATNLSGNLTGNVTATTLSGNLTGNVVAVTVNATANVTLGANVLVNTSAFYIAGNTTTAPTMTLIGAGLTVGNATITGAPQLIVANTSGATTINSNFISTTSISGNLTGNVSASYVNVSGQINTATLYSSGNIGIGVTPASFPLHIKATSPIDTKIHIENAGGANIQILAETSVGDIGTITAHPFQMFANNAAGNNRILIGAGGNVHIGNSTVTYVPTATLQVNGTLAVTTSANIGSSLLGNTTGFYPASNTVGSALGNTTARWTIVANNADFSTSVNATSFNVSTTMIANAIGVFIGANTVANLSAFYITGNTTTAPTATLLGTGLTVGNTTITGAPQLIVANTSGTTTINSIYISTTSISGNLTGNVTATTTTIGSAVTANALGLYVNSTSADLYMNSAAGIWANSSFGTAADVLTSNGTAVYWAPVTGGSGISVAEARKIVSLRL